MMNVEIRQNIQRKQVLIPETESHPELDGDGQVRIENSDDLSDDDNMKNLNRAERRKIQRQAKKSRVKRK